MKGIGALLVVGAGVYLSRCVNDRHRALIAQGEELLDVLQLLEQGVYLLRQPLPELMERCEAFPKTGNVWQTVSEGLGAEVSFSVAWRGAVSVLRRPYSVLLLPLGRTLPSGTCRELLQQVREDVYRAVGQARQESAERSRLAAALCLSVSLLLTVVLL